MYILNSIITITQASRKLAFKGVSEVRIERSIHNHTDRAVIQLPLSARIKQSNNTGGAGVQTARIFNVGDHIKIELGYNGNLRTEFEGFISEINLTQPLEIVCEGYAWILRMKKNIEKSWQSVSLKELLSEVIKNTPISLHPDIPDITLKNISINKANGTQVLDYIKDLFKDAITIYFINFNTLYAGLTYIDTTRNSVNYRLGYNTVEQDDLRYKKREDVTVNIELQYRTPTGQQKSIKRGDTSGTVKRDNISAIDNPKHIEDIAQAMLPT